MQGKNRKHTKTKHAQTRNQDCVFFDKCTCILTQPLSRLDFFLRTQGRFFSRCHCCVYFSLLEKKNKKKPATDFCNSLKHSLVKINTAVVKINNISSQITSYVQDLHLHTIRSTPPPTEPVMIVPSAPKNIYK